MTIFLDDPHEMVAKVIDRVGQKIVVATPLGIGKPIQFLNALYAQVKNNPTLELTLITALSVLRPKPPPNFTRPLFMPFLERVYGDYEDSHIEIDRRAQRLPKNIKVIEFFLAAGQYLTNPKAQQDFIYSNYTYVVRDILPYGINIIATMIAFQEDFPERVSFSSNTDLTKDLTKACPEALLVGQINNNLPYMYGPGAEINMNKFFSVLNNKDSNRKLFSVPKQPIDSQEYLIGLYASSLIRDDGCLQIGIGNLSDALVHSLILRHSKNEIYKNILDKLKNYGECSSPFSTGLFALTEMLVDGYLELYNNNILKKSLPDENNNCIAQAGFFIGSNAFYQQLRDMPKDERMRFSMCSISEINQLYGDEMTKRRQRTNASFVNTCMKASLLGEVISDSLTNGLTISGVGGQYNFVVMAQELADARSIMLCRSVYQKGMHVESNIIFKDGPITIPRHLRDIVVSEYGIAYLRGKTDSEVIKAMLNISDSRFQQMLLRQAKNARKLPADYEIPKQYTHNFPEKNSHLLNQENLKEIFIDFPFGTEFDEDEIILVRLLNKIKVMSKTKKFLTMLKGLQGTSSPHQQKLLERMNLGSATPKNILYRLLLVGSMN